MNPVHSRHGALWSYVHRATMLEVVLSVVLVSSLVSLSPL